MNITTSASCSMAPGSRIGKHGLDILLTARLSWDMPTAEPAVPWPKTSANAGNIEISCCLESRSCRFRHQLQVVNDNHLQIHLNLRHLEHHDADTRGIINNKLGLSLSCPRSLSQLSPFHIGLPVRCWESHLGFHGKGAG